MDALFVYVILGIALLAMLGGRLLRKEDDPRCTYRNGSAFWQTIAAGIAIAVAVGIFTAIK